MDFAAALERFGEAPLKDMFPEVKSRRDKRALYSMLSGGAPFQLLEMVQQDPSLESEEKKQLIASIKESIELTRKLK